MPRGVYQRTPEHREINRQAHLRPETREKQRQATLKQWRDPLHKEHVRRATSRRWASPGYRDKIKLLLATDEEKERRRLRNLSAWSQPGYREHMRKVMTGKRHSAETCAKLREIRLRRIFPQTMTSLESALCLEFKRRRLKFEMHKTMFSRWQPDFVFGAARLIVQADGDYWHNRPEVRERDHRFNEAATLAGWTVWRFSDNEILTSPTTCGRAVAAFIGHHPPPESP